MTGTAAAFLTTKLLGRIGNLTAVLGLGRTLTLVGEVLLDIEPDGVIVGLHTEDILIENDLLSGKTSVDFQNIKFHN